MKLYNYWRSSSSWRVRIALAHKGLPYEYVAVNLRSGEQHEPTYVQLNPTHTVPLLQVEDGGQVRLIHQSVAIIEYLEERYPDRPRLLPDSPAERAFVRELVELVNSGIQPYQNLQVLQKVKRDYQGDETAWARHFITQGLRGVEARVRSHGTFCAGSDVTLADVFLIPQLYGARRFGVDLAEFPGLTRVEAACEALAAFQQAHADRQPDAVVDSK